MSNAAAVAFASHLKSMRTASNFGIYVSISFAALIDRLAVLANGQE